MPNATVRDLPPVDPQQRYTVGEAALYLRCCRARVYERMQSGEILSILDGARRYVPGSEIVRLSTVPQARYQRSTRGGDRRNAQPRTTREIGS